jgi:hypothetical protein
MVTDKLKQLIFKHLYKELGNVEIIPYKDSVWFIDRENCYWYFQLSKDGCLFWRYSFFPSFFSIFSLEQSEFEPIISSWVEEVLNSKVSATILERVNLNKRVEDILNSNVSTTDSVSGSFQTSVEEVLNSKVSTTVFVPFADTRMVEEVLNHKVSETFEVDAAQKRKVKKVLDSKVSTTEGNIGSKGRLVEEVLNSAWVKKALNNKKENESNG